MSNGKLRLYALGRRGVSYGDGRGLDNFDDWMEDG